VRPEIEVFELGHIELARQLIAEGLIEAPALFQLCLGIKYGAPATTEAMQAMRDALPPGFTGQLLASAGCRCHGCAGRAAGRQRAGGSGG